jgi:hypothetical protein
VGGDEGTAWGAAKVVGAAQGAGELSEAGDEGAVQVMVVGPPREVV